MNKLFILIFIQVLLVQDLDYRKIFGEDYERALDFVKTNKTIFLILSEQYENDNELISSIAFPELVRYSIFNDFFETAALELLYVNYGSKYANFSVGDFQMRPTFIENLEKYCKEDSLLTLKYRQLISYSSQKDEIIRKERIRRIQSKVWSIRYLNCFSDILEKRFKIRFFTIDEKISFYAAAYNTGVQKSYIEIKKWEKSKIFPYGRNQDISQYSFASIAVDFYKKYYTEIF